MMMVCQVMPLTKTDPFAGGMEVKGVKVTEVVVTPMITTPPEGGKRRRMDFLLRSNIPEFGSKKGHPHDVADAFRQWAHCITYYHDYYEDSYLMPLVVSFLKGDASDMFKWTQSITPGGAQDLSTLFQMLCEHYCGS